MFLCLVQDGLQVSRPEDKTLLVALKRHPLGGKARIVDASGDDIRALAVQDAKLHLDDQ